MNTIVSSIKRGARRYATTGAIVLASINPHIASAVQKNSTHMANEIEMINKKATILSKDSVAFNKVNDKVVELDTSDKIKFGAIAFAIGASIFGALGTAMYKIINIK